MKVVRKEFHVCESIKLLETKPLEFRVFTSSAYFLRVLFTQSFKAPWQIS